MKMRKILAVICALAMICSFAVAASADEAKVTEIYTGDTPYSGWATVAEIYTTNWGGTLNPAFITEGGYLSVYLTSTEFWQVSVALNGATWAQLDCHVDPEKWTGGTLTDNGDGSYVVTFTYDELAAVYGSDFSGLGCVYLYSNSGGDTIVSKVTWTEAAAGETPEETEPETTVPEETEPETTVPEETEPETTAPAAKPVKDKVTTIASSVTVSSGWQMATSTYTSYWGGTLDPNFIEKDGYITVKITATGELWSAHVVLQGEEKNNHKWQQIDKEVGKNFTANADGSYTVKFTYDELVAAYGTSDFSDLGCVYVYVNSADGSTVTVNSVTYTVPGSNANTGDETMIVMAVATMLLTACCMVYMVTSKKRAR